MQILQTDIFQNIPGQYLADPHDIVDCLESIGANDLIGIATAIIATAGHGEEYASVWYTDSPIPYWADAVFIGFSSECKWAQYHLMHSSIPI